jgi:hypothetical protein
MTQIAFPEIGKMNVTALFEPLNTNSGDAFFTFLVFAIFLILVAILLFTGIKTSLLASSFITIFVGVGFFAIGLITWVETLVWGAIFILSLLYVLLG